MRTFAAHRLRATARRGSRPAAGNSALGWWLRVGLLMALSTLLGWLVSRTETPPVWVLLAVLLIVPSGVALARDMMHPLGLFPLLYLLYFLVGSQNWVELPGYASFRGFISTSEFLRIPVLALLGYLAGALLVGAKVDTGRSSNPSHTSTEWFARAAIALGLVGIAGTIVTVAVHGLVLTNPDARTGIVGYDSALTLALIPAGLLGGAVARRRLMQVGIPAAAGFLLFAVVGFRVTIIMALLAYLFLRALTNGVSRRTIVLGVAALATFALAIDAYRLHQDPDARVYRAQVAPTGLLAEVPLLAPLYYTIPREGAAVFDRLVTLIPEHHGYMRGRAQAATVLTLLPGEQIDARSKVTELVYATSDVRTTLTPTILGGPYMDFGVIGVVTEMALLGGFLAWLYRRIRQSRSPVAIAAYGYYLALAIAGIHTGLLDIQFAVGVPAMAAVALWLTARTTTRSAAPA